MSNEIKSYVKKPVTVEAIRWDGTAKGATPIIDWILRGGGAANYRCDGLGECPGTSDAHHINIGTLEGDMTASPGDFVIRGVQGEFYPCKPDIFAQTYEEAPHAH